MPIDPRNRDACIAPAACPGVTSGNQVPEHSHMRAFRSLALLAAVASLAIAAPSFARNTGPHYSGSKHTTSHGGHYAGGHGSSHKSGHYKNSGTGNQYGHHKPGT